MPTIPKKSGGITVFSPCVLGKEPIQSTYLINRADFVACHNQAYLRQYDMLKDLNDGGTFLLNTLCDETEIEDYLPASVKKALAKKHANFYIINAFKIAEAIGLGNRINMIMQAAFFKLTNVIPIDDAIQYLKEGIEKTYKKKGAAVVEMNCSAVDAGVEAIVQIPVKDEWLAAEDPMEKPLDLPEFVEELLIPMNKQEGDDLPVSAFESVVDGTFPSGTSKYEKTWRSHLSAPLGCIQMYSM